MSKRIDREATAVRTNPSEEVYIADVAIKACNATVVVVVVVLIDLRQIGVAVAVTKAGAEAAMVMISSIAIANGELVAVGQV